MAVAKYVDFERTEGGADFRPGGRRKRYTFYIPLFDATNRLNEQPTTVNIIFRSP